MIDKPVIAAINGVAVTGGLELAHYRQMANAATIDDAHMIEGYMAETWDAGTSLIADRRTEVTARGRAQTASTRADPAGSDRPQAHTDG